MQNNGINAAKQFMFQFLHRKQHTGGTALFAAAAAAALALVMCPFGSHCMHSTKVKHLKNTNTFQIKNAKQMCKQQQSNFSFPFFAQ